MAVSVEGSFDSTDVASTPKVGTYNTDKSSFGKQALSRNKSSVGFSRQNTKRGLLEQDKTTGTPSPAGRRALKPSAFGQQTDSRKASNLGSSFGPARSDGFEKKKKKETRNRVARSSSNDNELDQLDLLLGEAAMLCDSEFIRENGLSQSVARCEKLRASRSAPGISSAGAELLGV